MKKLSLCLFLILMFSFFTSHSFAENIPRNDPVPEGVMYKGVNEEQWKIIEKIGDPLNCRKRVYDFQQITDYHVVSPEDCKKNKHCIQHALGKNKHVKLKEGNYKIYFWINVDDQVLTGENGNVNINAEEVDTAVKVSNGTIANLNINFANNVAVHVKHNSLIYRVVAGNTGVKSSTAKDGYGFSFWDYKKEDPARRKKFDTFKSCLVSLESFNGYNEKGYSKPTVKGGNADGFAIKFGASDVTLIDTHAHHNSDDGYDFWKGGEESETPVIRLFYASANYNGKHPTRPNGDGNGFKFGSSNKWAQNKGKDKGARLIYGSVACGNKDKGFMRNRSPTKIISLGNESKKNRGGNYQKVSKKKVKDDKNLLKCSMFLK